MSDVAAVDLDAAESVTYVVQQRFRYEYDRPVYDLRHRLVVIPRASHGSLQRSRYRVTVSAANATVRERRDRHGNRVAGIRVAVVPECIEFTLGAAVRRTGPRTDCVLPADALTDPAYLRPTKLTTPDEALRTIARELQQDSADALEFAERCCAYLRNTMSYDENATSVTTTAADAWAIGRGVCQDYAHVMVAMCRTVGIPARYVSGHLVGEGGTHAWTEVIVAASEGARAVGFDPCNGCRPGSGHLPIAVGRDYRDVAPTSGHYSGGATGRLSVSKQVTVTEAA